ncbi:MAG: PilZ domain-containing protein [Deltaproteobacteria bacterium]|nr:PilZ domain-containing protein [Deltaproteobacteria bacterium]
MTNTHERRTQPRAQLHGNVTAFVGDERVDCAALDISAAGLAILSPQLRSPGQFVRVNFCLTPQAGTPRWYDADGVVVRATQGRGGVVLGVQFVVIEDRVARDVHAYVAATRQAAFVAEMRRVSGTSEVEFGPGGPPPERMPDANFPPKATGEFSPPAGARSPSTGETARHTTSEYGTSEPAPPAGPRRSSQTVAPAPAARTEGAPSRSRTPSSTATPAAPGRAGAAKPPTSDASRDRMNESAQKAEIAALIRDALAEVDGTLDSKKGRKK